MVLCRLPFYHIIKEKSIKGSKLCLSIILSAAIAALLFLPFLKNDIFIKQISTF